MTHEIEMKTIVALSEEFADQLPIQLNAIGHMCQSLGYQIARAQQGRFVEYEDALGTKLSLLSWWPLIVLSGRPRKIAQAWDDLRPLAVPCALFTDTMIAGGSEVQLATTKSTTLSQSRIVGIAAFGEVATLNRITKKLGLWRQRTEKSGTFAEAEQP